MYLAWSCPLDAVVASPPSRMQDRFPGRPIIERRNNRVNRSGMGNRSASVFLEELTGECRAA